MAIDANQIWGVADAIAWVKRLAEFNPYWIEEPTSPDDVLGHAAVRDAVRPIRVTTGEHVANPVVFKQLLQADAIDAVQIDACRVGGVNENVAILLLAAKFGVPVCPHAGGVRLCELVQHLAMFDFVAVSGSWTGRYVEYVDHLHEHFVNPAEISADDTSRPSRRVRVGRCANRAFAPIAIPTAGGVGGWMMERHGICVGLRPGPRGVPRAARLGLARSKDSARGNIRELHHLCA